MTSADISLTNDYVLDENRGFSGAYNTAYFAVMVLDISGSIGLNGIRQLEEGYSQWIDMVSNNSELAPDARVAVIAFNDTPQIVLPWTFVEQAPKTISLSRRGGGTNIALAMEEALKLVEEHRTILLDSNTLHYKPNLILVTDSQGSSGDYKAVAAKVRELALPWKDKAGKEHKARLVVHPAAVNGAKGHIPALFHPRGMFYKFDLEHMEKFVTLLISSLTASIASHSRDPNDTVGIVEEMPEVPPEIEVCQLLMQDPL